MADVSTYKRALVSYVASLGSVKVGEVRASTDAMVLANPAYWVAFTDTDMSNGRTKVS